jgi:formylglycine-generating enzyme required for sulfatase activity
MKKISLFLLFFVLSLSAIAAQQKYALVIGNSNYANVGTLKNPANDARDVKAALEGLGFTVDLVLDGTLGQMEDAAVRLKNRLTGDRNAWGFFFYSGHGVQSDGQNYLIPVDAEIRSAAFLRQRAVSMQVVLDELNEAGNALNLVIFDACRDYPAGWTKSANKGLSVIGNQPADSIIVYATAAGATAADGTGRNSPFTAAFIKNLKTPGLEIREVFRRTHNDVREATRDQLTPQRPAVYDSYGGLAYLGSKPAPVAAAPAQPAPKPAPQQPAARVERPNTADFVRIEGGTFTMGSPSSEPERFDWEGPQHQVTVGSFSMGKHEVTQAEYEAVMGTNPSYFKGTKLPVEQVSWYDAIEYCNKRSEKEGLTPAYTVNRTRVDPNNKNSDDNDNLKWQVTWNKNSNGYRLPTEAEWEYACRAGTATPFSTGSNITTAQANYDGNYPYNKNKKGTYREKTTDAGSFAANSWGLHDMHGNVWEWCWDWYGAYSSGAQSDPGGAVSGAYRVYRGGSWHVNGRYLRSAYRDYFTPSHRFNYLGFRLVRP